MCNDISLNRLLQLIANRSSNPFSLITGANKQTVKIACFINIAKTHNGLIINRNNTKMFLKRLVPLYQIHLPGCPCIQLFFCIILCIDSVNRIIKQFRQFPAI